MSVYRIALANIRFPATREESVALAEDAIAQASQASDRPFSNSCRPDRLEDLCNLWLKS